MVEFIGGRGGCGDDREALTGARGGVHRAEGDERDFRALKHRVRYTKRSRRCPAYVFYFYQVFGK